MRGIFAKNLFSQDIVFKKPAPWHKSTDRVFLLDDEQILLFKNYLAETYLFEPKTSALFEAIVVSAYNNSFHPVKDYFNSLEWDQFPRLATWLSKYMGVDDNTYTRSVGLKTLTAAVKRIYEPGCEFDNMLILEGDQGIGKSRAVEILSSPWYSNQKIHIANKDVVSTMFGQLIVEIAEMEAHRKAEVEEMKAFLSCAKDRVRLPYMRIAKDYPRQCIFIGTFNPKKDEDIGYLKDMTGNRRYWPVHCKSIDRDVLYKVKHQLWAEAVHHYKNKTKIYLDDAKIELMAREEQEKRVGFDPWHSKIKEWVNQHEVYKHRLVIKGDEIYTDCLSGKINFYDRRAQTRIADIMERIGWTRGVHYSVERNEPTRGYKRPMIE
jgi:putative DNA primase/helicase